MACGWPHDQIKTPHTRGRLRAHWHRVASWPYANPVSPAPTNIWRPFAAMLYSGGSTNCRYRVLTQGAEFSGSGNPALKRAGVPLGYCIPALKGQKSLCPSTPSPSVGATHWAECQTIPLRRGFGRSIPHTVYPLNRDGASVVVYFEDTTFNHEDI